MKFKSIYLYGAVAVIAVVVLIVVVIQDKSNSIQPPVTDEQVMPNDDVHNQLKNQTSTSPGKENVSEEYRKKLAELEQAVKENPTDTIAIRKYADYLTASHKMNEAIPHYEKILTINPKRSDIRFSLALIYFNQRDFNKCDEENEKVLSYDPQNQMALYNLGAVAATQGLKEKAKEYWNKVITINENTETAQLAKESLAKL
jgi:tetratricopeptide (TPR) repeat protein